MYARNSSGPSTLPCGTPDVTVTSSDNCPPAQTLCIRLKRNSLIHVAIADYLPWTLVQVDNE
jgi:hypothetical protein